MNNGNQHIGGTIRQRREALGWSLSELARRSGVSRGYLHLIENGDANPSYLKLNQIAEALGALDLMPAANTDMTSAEGRLLSAWRDGNYSRILRMIANKVQDGTQQPDTAHESAE